MIVSDRHKFIFIHVPRSAGTSMHHALRTWETRWTKWRLDYSKAQWGRSYPHYLAREIHPIVGDKRFESYAKLAFVRNPWDRIVSRYYYLRRQKDNNPNRVLNERGYYPPGDLTFLEWLKGSTRNCIHPLEWRPQMAWLTDESGKFVVDHVGRFEHVEDDFRRICHEIGIDVSLPKINSAKEGHYRDHYDEEAKEIIASRFAEDIAEWEYAF